MNKKDFIEIKSMYGRQWQTRSVQKTHNYPRWYRNCHNTLYAYRAVSRDVTIIAIAILVSN